jgi:hypothetical protein
VLLNTTASEATTVSFAPPQTFVTDIVPNGFGSPSVAVADVNGDGKPDLLAANNGSGTVAVVLNTTAPGATVPAFAPPQSFATGCSQGVGFLTAADVNGDGKPDLVVGGLPPLSEFGSTYAKAVSVLLNQTAPGATAAAFAPDHTFAPGTSAVAAVGDVNGDGLPDLLTTDIDYTVAVWLNLTAPGAAVPVFAPLAALAGGQDFPRPGNGGR